jgi:hypothetical protein
VSQFPDKIPNLHAEGIRNNLKGLNRHVAFTAFDLADMRAVETGAIAENVLRPAPRETKGADGRADLLLNILHSQQFQGTLVKSIQVITCMT